MQKQKLRLDELQVDSFVTTDTSGKNEIVGGSASFVYYGVICVDTQGHDVCNLNPNPPAGGPFDTLVIDCRTVGALCFGNESGNPQCINGVNTNEQQCPTGGWGGGGFSCNVNNC